MGGLLREILAQDCTSLYIINTYLWKCLMRMHSLRVLPWCKTIDSKTIWEQIYASLEDEFSDKTLEVIEKVKFSILASTCCELYHNLQYSKFWKWRNSIPVTWVIHLINCFHVAVRLFCINYRLRQNAVRTKKWQTRCSGGFTDVLPTFWSSVICCCTKP